MEGLFRGTWYRSAVKLEGERIIPIPPFEAYNVFDSYFSASNVRQGEKSLHLEFLGVDASKPDEILAFCERFGVLGSAWMVIAQSLTHEETLKKQEGYDPHFRFKDPLNHQKKIDLTHIAGHPDPQSFAPKSLCPEMWLSSFKESQKVLQHVLSSPKDPKIPYAAKMNDCMRLSRIHPSLYWDAQAAKWGISWSSLDLLGLLLVMVMLDLLGPGKVLSCPRCHKFFLTASNKVRFCSSSCGDNFKVQKYQKKEKELAARKRKKAKTTKSTGKKK
jgi:hypothetical protein